jgi:hypothetical protein
VTDGPNTQAPPPADGNPTRASRVPRLSRLAVVALATAPISGCMMIFGSELQPGLYLAALLAYFFLMTAVAFHVRLSREPLRGTVYAVLALLIVFLSAALIPCPGIPPEKQQERCVRQVERIGRAVVTLAWLRRGGRPSSEEWCDYIVDRFYLADESELVCPEQPSSVRSSYAMNARLADRLDDYEPDTVLLFEADLGWHGAGGPENLPPGPRHPDGYVFCFVDGSVRVVPKDGIPALKWGHWPARRGGLQQ